MLDPDDVPAAARPGEVDLLLPVRDLGHLLPVRGRLDGRLPGVEDQSWRANQRPRPSIDRPGVVRDRAEGETLQGFCGEGRWAW